MKIAIFLLLSLTPLLSFSQNGLYLVKHHVNNGLYLAKYHVNMGYTSENNLIIDLGIRRNNWYYGLSLQPKFITGKKGSDYTGIIGWDENSSEIKSDGKYYDIAEAEIGYFFTPNICAGYGIGLAIQSKYQNRYDDTGILSCDGNYCVSKSFTGNAISGKFFIIYYFDNDNRNNRWYIKGQCDSVSRVGLSVGYNFNI